MTANTKQPEKPSDELDYVLSKWKRIPMTTKKSGKKSKITVWGICWKDREFCASDITGTTIQIFKSKKLASLLAKPHYRVCKLLITELPLPRTVKKEKR